MAIEGMVDITGLKFEEELAASSVIGFARGVIDYHREHGHIYDSMVDIGAEALAKHDEVRGKLLEAVEKNLELAIANLEAINERHI